MNPMSLESGDAAAFLDVRSLRHVYSRVLSRVWRWRERKKQLSHNLFVHHSTPYDWLATHPPSLSCRQSLTSWVHCPSDQLPPAKHCLSIGDTACRSVCVLRPGYQAGGQSCLSVTSVSDTGLTSRVAGFCPLLPVTQWLHPARFQQP